MLRIYFMQQWFSFTCRQMENAFYEIKNVWRFAGVMAALPDEASIFKFRH